MDFAVHPAFAFDDWRHGLATKVLTEPGAARLVSNVKGLISDNFTTAEKTKLAGIAEGAQVNTIEHVKLGGTELTVTDKAVNIPIDGDLSQTSNNPVRNYAVTLAINALRRRVDMVPGASIDSWGSLAGSVQQGNGESVAPVATRMYSPYTDSRVGNSTRYDVGWNVVHHGNVEPEGGTERPGMFLQMDRCLPFDTMMSNYQAFLCAVTAIPAGTYNVTMGFNWGKVVNGTSYQFTLANDLPAGGQLAGFYGAPDQNPSSWRVYAFASATATSATETCVVTEGSEGTNLGTFTAAGVKVPASGTPESVSEAGELRFYGLNSLHRVAYGNNRWAHSALRQFLNGTGQGWWEPQHVFDRPPSYVGYDGFLSGLDADFLAVVQPTKVVTALNYVTDGGTSGAPEYDVTYDRFFLPSGRQHFLQDNATFGGGQGKEGEQWDYWRMVAGTTSALGWSSWGSYGTYHPEFIQFDLASPTGARGCWMRSAGRGSGNNAAYVNSVGNVSNNNAVSGHRAAAACVIC